jgi:hypothetical protein
MNVFAHDLEHLVTTGYLHPSGAFRRRRAFDYARADPSEPESAIRLLGMARWS